MEISSLKENINKDINLIFYIFKGNSLYNIIFNYINQKSKKLLLAKIIKSMFALSKTVRNHIH